MQIIETPIVGYDGLSPMDGGGRKGIVHTIEGGTETNPDGTIGLLPRMRAHDPWASAQLLSSAVRYTDGYVPHYTISPVLRLVHRHLPHTVGGYALADTAGGIRPNRAGDAVLQVELVGHAAQLSQEYTDADWIWLGATLAELGEDAGVPWKWGHPFLPYPASYGATTARLNADEYVKYSGWLGHMHVPENDHGDPGVLNLQLMDNGAKGLFMEKCWRDPRYDNVFNAVTGVTIANSEADPNLGWCSIITNDSPHDIKLAACCRISFGIEGATPADIVAKAEAAGYLVRTK